MARKRPSNRIVKEIFDPVLPAIGGSASGGKTEAKEKNVFFQDRQRIVIMGPREPESSRPPAKGRPKKSLVPPLLFLAAFTVFSAFASNWIFSFFELEHQIPATQELLRAKIKQARALEVRFNERKKEREDLNQFFQRQEEERKSIVSKLRFLRRRLGERKGGRGGSDLLWELARLLPPQVWFQEFSVGLRHPPNSMAEILVRGYAVDRNSLRSFLKSLADSPHFENPRLLSLERGRGYYLFEANADVAQ